MLKMIEECCVEALGRRSGGFMNAKRKAKRGEAGPKGGWREVERGA